MLSDEPLRTLSSVICDAITRRRVLKLCYKEQSRAVAPYILGFTEKGELQLSAVQMIGGSSRGFRSFDVAGLSDIEVTDVPFFAPHSDYNPRDRHFARVLCQV